MKERRMGAWKEGNRKDGHKGSDESNTLYDL
jgi:hypothetical protein